MAEKEQNKKGFWKSLFSKEEAIQEAESYGDLTFFKKTKNVLITFIVAVSILSVGLAMYGNMESFRFEDVIIDVVAYLVLLPFVYFNHRWAMVLVCLLYGAGKFIMIALGLGTPISHLIFLMIAVSLTYKSFLVASYLKKQKLKG